MDFPWVPGRDRLYLGYRCTMIFYSRTLRPSGLSLSEIRILRIVLPFFYHTIFIRFIE